MYHYKLLKFKMEKIRIKTAGALPMNAWKSGEIHFIILNDLLSAMRVEYIEDVVQYIKQDMHWFTSVKQLDIPEIGTCDVVQITHALGIIYWLPENIVEFFLRHQVFNMLAVHLQLRQEFFNWKVAEFGRIYDRLEGAYKEMEKQSNIIIENQSAMIDELKKNWNIN